MFAHSLPPERNPAVRVGHSGGLRRAPLRMKSSPREEAARLRALAERERREAEEAREEAARLRAHPSLCAGHKATSSSVPPPPPGSPPPPPVCSPSLVNEAGSDDNVSLRVSFNSAGGDERESTVAPLGQPNQVKPPHEAGAMPRLRHGAPGRSAGTSLPGPSSLGLLGGVGAGVAASSGRSASIATPGARSVLLGGQTPLHRVLESPRSPYMRSGKLSIASQALPVAGEEEREASCAACGKIIARDRKKVKALNLGWYHRECFKCAISSTQLYFGFTIGEDGEDATTLTSVPRHARPLAPLPPRPRHPSPDPTPSRRVLLQAARAGTAWRHHRRRELHALGERERADTVLLAGTAARRVKSLRRNATLFMCVLTPGRTLCRVRHV